MHSITMGKLAFGDRDSLVLEYVKPGAKLWMVVSFKEIGIYRQPHLVMVSYAETESTGENKAFYNLEQSDQGSSLAITEWNPATNSMKGNFKFKLRKEHFGPPEERPATPEYITIDGDFTGTVTIVP